MNHDEIVEHLIAAGFNVTFDESSNCLSVLFDINGEPATLRHCFPESENIERLPVFSLLNPIQFGQLAHIMYSKDKKIGAICAGDNGSVSINYDVPTLVYEYALNRQIKLVRRAATDTTWNQSELIREFSPNWALICDKNVSPTLYCTSSNDPNGHLLTKSAVPKAKFGLPSMLLALDESVTKGDVFERIRCTAKWDSRPASGKTIMLTLSTLEPAPIDACELSRWYISAINSLSPTCKAAFGRYARLKSRRHWVIFNATTPTGIVRCAIRFDSVSEVKQSIPLSDADCKLWHIHPIEVAALDREALLPRSGAMTELHDKSVLIVGCGSVGSELATAVACTGIGKIHLSDPERFSSDNLYRHTLGLNSVDLTKSGCVAYDLSLHYPWVVAHWDLETLQSKTDTEKLNQYDLIIVVIGAPTIERQFHDFVTENDVQTPVLYTWLEGYGIGGHAVLDIPGSQGCLRCAYLDPDTCEQGLASNLNFLSPNQDITVTLAGCGHQFIPYGGISAKTTAAMAADMVMGYLTGLYTDSSRVSWRGNEKAALSAGLSVSFRYQYFTQSLKVEPLKNRECEVCVG